VPTVRDKLWIWGHEAGSHNDEWDLPGPSRMTPTEGAFYLGVPNALMVSYYDLPKPPFDREMRAFAPLKRVVWSIVGESSSARTDLDEVLRLAGRFPNLCGAIMDDFFYTEPKESGAISRVSVEQLRGFRARLQGATRPLDLWVTVYTHDLRLPIQPYLEPCDVLTFWTWRAEHLADLEGNFARLEALAPAKRKVLGCYMWDYGPKKPMPLAAMRRQCQLGLEWLRAGRIEGMIFLASCICDLGLETVEWTRRWIAEV